MSKGRCRGRSVAYADADGNGRLDLLASCEGDLPRVFAQVFRGGFVQIGSPHAVGSAYRWAQLGRGGTELLVSTRRGLEVWRSRNARMEPDPDRRKRPRGRSGSRSATTTTRAPSTSSSPARAAFTCTPIAADGCARFRSRLGLPGHAAAASFVDYDNDGRLDVSVAPQGIYRWNRGRGRFEHTGALNMRKVGYAIVEWMDYDNDGRRDPLIATSRREFSPSSHVIRKRNVTRAGHWLEVELKGGPVNREAIGGKVVAHLRGGRTLSQWVGQNDDARHSQGHYRLYFGLGSARVVKRLVVHWPGGRKTRLRKVGGDRLLRISSSR